MCKCSERRLPPALIPSLPYFTQLGTLSLLPPLIIRSKEEVEEPPLLGAQVGCAACALACPCARPRARAYTPTNSACTITGAVPPAHLGGGTVTGAAASRAHRSFPAALPSACAPPRGLRVGACLGQLHGCLLHPPYTHPTCTRNHAHPQERAGLPCCCLQPASATVVAAGGQQQQQQQQQQQNLELDRGRSSRTPR